MIGTAARAGVICGGVICAMALLAMAGCSGSGDRVREGPVSSAGTAARPVPTLRGIVPAGSPELPEVTLTDTANRPFRLPGDLRAPVTVLFFGYTHCPNACPTALADLAQALRRIPDRELVQVVFITVDPAQDSPARLRTFLDRFDPSFTGLTGPEQAIRKAARAVGVAVGGTRNLDADTGEGHGPGGYEVSHGAQLVGLAAGHRSRVIWPEGTSVRDLEHDIAALLKEYG